MFNKKHLTSSGTVISAHTIWDDPWYITEIVVRPEEGGMLLKASFTESDKEKIYKKGDTVPLVMGEFTWEIDNT